MIHRTLRAAALACTLPAVAPTIALAGPISGYPAATTPLSGSETMIGTQGGATVQISAQSIDNILLAATSTWTGVQTFPAPGPSKGSIVLPPGTISGAPANGSLWTTSGGLFVETSGSTQQLAQTGANSFAGTQTFPDSGTWSSSGVSGLTNLGLGVGAKISQSGAAMSAQFNGSSGFSGLTLAEGSTNYFRLFESSGDATLSLNNVGVMGWSSGGATGADDTAFSRVGTNEIAVGNGTAGDASGRLDAAKVAATSQLIMPSDGVGGNVDRVTTTTAHFDAQQGYFGGSTGVPGTPGYPGLLIGGAFASGTAGVIQGGNPAGTSYITPLASYPMAWNLEVFNGFGLQIFGIENGARDQQILQIGTTRFCSATLNCIGQQMFSDGMVDGAITAFGSVAGGSGYVNGSYADVPLAGGAGVLAKADITVSGGAVTAVVLHSPARGGAGYGAGDSLTTSNTNLGGSGSGFSVAVSTVTSGVAGSPYILMDGTDGDFMSLGASGPTAAHKLGERYLRLGGITDSGNEAGGVWSFTSNDAFNFETAGGVVAATISGGAWTRQAEIVGSTTVPGMLFVTAPTLPGTLGAAAPISVSFERQVAVTLSALNTADPLPSVGDRATITDATTCAFNSSVTGGGSSKCPVVFNGSAWVAG